jgi:hypothetical protein
MCTSDDLDAFCEYVIKYRNDFDSINNYMLGGNNKTHRTNIIKHMCNSLGVLDYKITVTNLFTIFTHLFIHCDRNSMSLNSFSLLNCLIIKDVFNKYTSSSKDIQLKLTDLLSFLNTKYGDILPIIDEFVLNEDEIPDSDASPERIIEDTFRSSISSSIPSSLAPSLSVSHTSTLASTTCSLTTIAATTPITTTSFITATTTTGSMSTIPILSSGSTVDPPRLPNTDTNFALMITEFQKMNIQQKEFQEKMFIEIKGLVQSNVKQPVFDSNRLKEFDINFDRLYRKLIRTEASIKSFKLHKEKNLAPDSLDYLRFPKPILKHDDEYIDEYNDFLSTLQQLTIDFNISFFPKKRNFF